MALFERFCLSGGCCSAHPSIVEHTTVAPALSHNGQSHSSRASNTSQPTPATVFLNDCGTSAKCAIQGNLPVPLLRNRSPQVRSRTSPSFLASRLQVKQVQATGNSDFQAHLALVSQSFKKPIASQKIRISMGSARPQKFRAIPSRGWHTAQPLDARKTPLPYQCHALQAPW